MALNYFGDPKYNPEAFFQHTSNLKMKMKKMLVKVVYSYRLTMTNIYRDRKKHIANSQSISVAPINASTNTLNIFQMLLSAYRILISVEIHCGAQYCVCARACACCKAKPALFYISRCYSFYFRLIDCIYALCSKGK